MTWHVWFALAVIGWLWVSFVWAVIDTMRSGNSGIMHTMKLYLIEQDEIDGYDFYDSAVVCATDEESAKNTLPDGAAEFGGDSWCSGPDKVKVTLIGEAATGIQPGPVCASFSAG